MSVIVPPVEVSHHRNLARVRRPDSEIGPTFAVNGRETSTELVVSAVVSPFIEQVKIVRGENASVMADGKSAGWRVGVHVEVPSKMQVRGLRMSEYGFQTAVPVQPAIDGMLDFNPIPL